MRVRATICSDKGITLKAMDMEAVGAPWDGCMFKGDEWYYYYGFIEIVTPSETCIPKKNGKDNHLLE